MSQPKIVRCVAVFVALATLVASVKLNGTIVKGHIDQAIERITKYTECIREILYGEGSQHDEKSANVIGQLKRNMTLNMKWVRKTVDNMIKNSNTTFNASECRGYLTDYEEQEESIRNDLEAVITREWKETLKTHTEARKKLMALSDLADRCSGNRKLCDDVEQIINEVLSNVFKRTAPYADDLGNPTEELKSFLSSLNDVVQRAGDYVVFEEVQSCLSPGTNDSKESETSLDDIESQDE